MIKPLAIVSLCLTSMLGCSQMPKPQRETFNLRSFETAFGYAQAVRVGDRLVISGSVSMDAQGSVIGKGDMPTQVRQAYQDIAKTLAHFGVGFDAVIRETVFTTDLDAFMRAAPERAIFYNGQFPAASWLEVKRLVSTDFLVEVEVEAYLGG